MAFISCNHETSWSRQRHLGASDAITSLGGVLKPFTEPWTPPSSITKEGVSLRKIVLDKLFPGELPHNELVKERSLSIPYFHLSEMPSRAAERVRIRRLLDHAGSIRDCSALICANDATALICLDILEVSGSTVPNDFAIVGFDNSVESMLWKCTSYSFNETAVVNSMIAHLLGSAWIRLHAARNGYITIDGYIVERDTA
jgi:hypothetical protein